ncbi:MAG: DUF86 domain-containing protein [Chitinophagales bacterium]|nr:DUF86 domain-containing protein [Chitinophagales bacterium]
MDESIKKYLYDIKVSIESINEYLLNKRSFTEYEQNKLLRRAIERELEIIGEATVRIKAIDSNFRITEIAAIKALRNRIAHEYDGIDNNRIWTVVNNHLPLLLKEVETYLAE